MEKHPLHLKLPDLQTSPEVKRAVERKERRTGERVPNDPAERIEAYTERLENIFLNKDERVRERNLDLFREDIYDKLLIKRGQFPESYFELQKRVARERGQHVEEIPEATREQMKAVAIEDQKHSLDAWMAYLTSSDAVYPAWFKYFVWRNITKLSQFDKERGEFKKRTDSTVAPFPDIYREPLAQICDLYEKVKGDNKTLKDSELQRQFSEKFPSLYAELIQQSLSAQLERKEETRGQWVKYEQGEEGAGERLFASLEGKGTGWCTAGHSTANTQVESGDFYVYYTNDQTNKPTQPRLAIRMEGNNKIGEVRGILPQQGVEPVMQDVLDSKLKEFGGEADKYRRKSEDMKRLTLLERKQEAHESFTRKDLLFLYEIGRSPIEGFGYDKDPRVEELRENRDQKADLPVIFDCRPDQITYSPYEITEDTKAYIGPISKRVIDTLREHNLEHIYTSFPEGKVKRYETELGGTTKDTIKRELTDKKIYVSDWANQLIEHRDFKVLRHTERADLVRLTVKDLGFPNGATTEQIYRKAEELGLELCPSETGPRLRLSTDDPDYMLIAMEQITGRGGDPRMFSLGSVGDVLGLGAGLAGPGSGWDGNGRFVFLLRKRPLET